MESEFLAAIRVWAAVAWADGVMARPEAAALKRLIDGTRELDENERTIALGFIDRSVSLETAGVAKLSPAARQGIYRAAVRLANIDLGFAPEEKALLDRLRAGLGLDEATAREIEASVKK